MRIWITQNIPAEKWDSYVLSHKDSEIFHLSVWKEILQKSFGYTPYYIVATDSSGKLTGVLPLMYVRSRLTGTRLVSLPFSYVCGPLADSKEVMFKLIHAAIDLSRKKKCDYLEIKLRNHEPTLLEAGLVENNSYNTYVLDLKREEHEIWEHFHKSCVQRAIKKAIREKIQIRLSSLRNGITSFHYLNILTAKKHGTPPQPLAFFNLIQHYLEPHGLVKLFLAYYHGNPIAAAIFFVFQKKIYYMYGASNPKYLRYRPNQLLMWEAIKWAQKGGFELFDLGRVFKADTNLARYKIHWGATQRELHYYYWPKVKGIETVGRQSIKLRMITRCLRSLPPRLLEKGALLYRHLG